MIHKPGTKMIPSDILSRRPDYIKAPDEHRLLLPLHKVAIEFSDQSLIEEIKEAQSNDTLGTKIRIPLKSKLHPTNPKWSLSDGLLYYRNLIYIPPDKQNKLRSKITRLVHDSPAYGHPGIYRTQAILQRSVWWPQMSLFISKFIQGCALCQQMKINTHPTVPPIQPIKPLKEAQPFQTITMDFITALPESKGFNSLMVVVDHDVTKGVVIIPCTKTIDAIGTAKLYLDNVFRRFGLPKVMISDRGPQFASKVFQELCSHLGVKSKLSTAFHPQTDGQTERMNQEIEAYLRIYCSNHPETWTDHIPLMEFAHNVNIHSATRASPFKLLYGFDPITLPHDLETKSSIPSVSDRLKELSNQRKEAQAALELSRNVMIRFTTRKFTPFTPGQKVWLEATHLNTPNRSSKISPKREGPFQIKNKLSDLVYELKLPHQWRIHPIFHASLLTPFKQTEEHGPSFAQPPPDIIEGEEEYEIEAILAHRGKGTRQQFLVKWLGYPDSENEWKSTRELLQNARELLTAYKSTHHLS